MEYFSDKERGPRPRIEETINPIMWGGIAAYIQTLVSTGAFGYHFPESCPDGTVTIGTDQSALLLAIQTEIPGLYQFLEDSRTYPREFSWDRVPFVTDTLLILDLVEFCYRTIAQPIKRSYHEFFQHYHLAFDIQAGRYEFRERINTIFSRNGVAYELDPNRVIVRLAPPILRETLINIVFQTSDQILDQMLEEARSKFINPDASVRREAMERLWDAWERIKTLEQPGDKRTSISILLGKVAREANFRLMLEEETRKLTDIGNSFHIRHSEVSQTRVSDSDHIDYLFHRLFAMIMLLLRKR